MQTKIIWLLVYQDESFRLSINFLKKVFILVLLGFSRKRRHLGGLFCRLEASVPRKSCEERV